VLTISTQFGHELDKSVNVAEECEIRLNIDRQKGAGHVEALPAGILRRMGFQLRTRRHRRDAFELAMAAA
jgi:hypothetical protein